MTSRRQTFRALIAISALAVIALLNAADTRGATLAHRDRLITTTVPPAALSADAQPLTPDQPITDSLDDKIGYRFYKFNARMGESYRVTIEVKTGNFWTNTTITGPDSDVVLGSTQGDTLIDSMLHFAIPQDDTYNVLVDYITPTFGTPAPGTFTITLSKVTAK